MPVYATTFDTPEPLRSFIQCVQGMATIVAFTDSSITITIESDDEYELATTVRELQDEMNTLLGYNYVLIERPKLIDVLTNPAPVPSVKEIRETAIAARVERAKKAKANKCGVCGTSALKCEQGVFGKEGAACCATCGTQDTHDMSVEDWKAFRDENGEAIGLNRHRPRGAINKAERAAPASPPKHRHRWQRSMFVGGLEIRRCSGADCAAYQTNENGVWK